jgi:hypothetical protein
MVMAAVIGSIQRGRTVVPWLIHGVHRSAPADVTPITPAETTQLRTLLHGVVTSGTGRGLADVPKNVRRSIPVRSVHDAAGSP